MVKKEKDADKDFKEYDILYMVFQMILGLGYLHNKNIVHRDMKELNLLLDKNSNIKICDFGLAH